MIQLLIFFIFYTNQPSYYFLSLMLLQKQIQFFLIHMTNMLASLHIHSFLYHSQLSHVCWSQLILSLIPNHNELHECLFYRVGSGGIPWISYTIIKLMHDQLCEFKTLVLAYFQCWLCLFGIHGVDVCRSVSPS